MHDDQYPFPLNNMSTFNINDGDDIQQQEPILERMNDDLIPEGPYSPITKGKLNYY